MLVQAADTWVPIHSVHALQSMDFAQSERYALNEQHHNNHPEDADDEIQPTRIDANF